MSEEDQKLPHRRCPFGGAGRVPAHPRCIARRSTQALGEQPEHGPPPRHTGERAQRDRAAAQSRSACRRQVGAHRRPGAEPRRTRIRLARRLAFAACAQQVRARGPIGLIARDLAAAKASSARSPAAGPSARASAQAAADVRADAGAQGDQAVVEREHGLGRDLRAQAPRAVRGLDRRLHLVGAQAPAGRPRAAAPPRPARACRRSQRAAVLHIERHVGAGVVAPGRGAAFAEQHQRQQAQRLGLPRHQAAEDAAQVDGLAVRPRCALSAPSTSSQPVP